MINPGVFNIQLQKNSFFRQHKIIKQIILKLEKKNILMLNTFNESALSLSFNNDRTSFTCGLTNGFLVCSTSPYKEIFRREFGVSGFCVVEIYMNSNILALVGSESGYDSIYPRNIMLIWDDIKEMYIARVEFKSDIKTIKFTKNRIFVVIESCLYIYELETLKLIKQFNTSSNPTGAFCVVELQNKIVMAFPDEKRGYVKILSCPVNSDQFEDKSYSICVTESDIAYLDIDSKGSLLAVSSKKGTLIYIYDLDSNKLLHEFRRGSKAALIHSLKFSPNSNLLAVSSDQGTIHLFQIYGNNTTSILRMIPFHYFKSTWSISKIHLNDSYNVCGFLTDNELLVLSKSGLLSHFTITPVQNGLKVNLSNRVQFLNN